MENKNIISEGSVCFNDRFKKPVCILKPFNDVHVYLSKKPNIFHRFMMRCFFGFKFEDIKR